MPTVLRMRPGCTVENVVRDQNPKTVNRVLRLKVLLVLTTENEFKMCTSCALFSDRTCLPHASEDSPAGRAGTTPPLVLHMYTRDMPQMRPGPASLLLIGYSGDAANFHWLAGVPL